VDYVALNGELFGALDASGVSHLLVDDDEQWKPGMASPDSALSSFTASNSTEAVTSNDNGDDNEDSDLLEVFCAHSKIRCSSAMFIIDYSTFWPNNWRVLYFPRRFGARKQTAW